MTDHYSNFAASTVYGGASGAGSALQIGDLTLLVNPGDGSLFPAAPFPLVLGGDTPNPEIVECTTIAGDSLTITRAQEGTAQRGWDVGTLVQHTVTANGLNALESAVSTLTSEVATLTTEVNGLLAGPLSFPMASAGNVTQIGITNAGAGNESLNLTAGAASSKIALTAGSEIDLTSPVVLLSGALKGGSVPYNVRAYGAKGDGIHDDGPAFRAALLDIQIAGRGALRVPGGVYSCSTAGNAENGSYLAIGFLPPNCLMYGDGMDATIIKLQNNATSGSKVFMNWHIQSGGDSNITVMDLTFDGNSQNQTFTNGCRGFHVMRMSRLHCHRVRFKDMYGTGGGTTESTATTVDFCTDCVYMDCEAYGSGASPISDTGFAANFCTNVNYIGCLARGLGGGGFTNSYCTGFLHSNCYSILNGTYGFNTEQPNTIRYVNCQSGGAASLHPSWNYYQGQRLGNGSHGFVVLGGTDTLGNPQFAPTLAGSSSGGTLAAGVWTVAFTYQTASGETQVGTSATVTTTGSTSSITVSIPKLPPDACTGWNIYVSQAAGSGILKKSNGTLQTGTSYVVTTAPTGAAVPASNTATYTITVSVVWENCSSSYNGGCGLQLSTVTSGFTRLLWQGGEILGNASYGIAGGAGDQLSVIGHPNYSGNNGGNPSSGMRSGGMDHDVYGGLMTPGPAVPASGTELLNPYMIPVVVGIMGGTVTAVAKGKSGAEVTVATASNVTVPLYPGEYIKLTYSAAPTWAWTSAL